MAWKRILFLSLPIVGSSVKREGNATACRGEKRRRLLGVVAGLRSFSITLRGNSLPETEHLKTVTALRSTPLLDLFLLRSHLSSTTDRSSSACSSFSSLFHHTRLLRLPSTLSSSSSLPFQCGDCGKNFRLLNALHHHILTKHAGKAQAMKAVDGKLQPVESDQAGKSVTSVASKRTSSFSTSSGSSAAYPAMAPPFPGMPIGVGGGLPIGCGVGCNIEKKPSATPSGGVPHGNSSATVTGSTSAGDPEKSETPTFSSSEQTPSGAMSGTAVDDDRQGKSTFVCTICQKTFRLEAALQHHYQAKHNMNAPVTTSSGNSSSSTGEASATHGGSAESVVSGSGSSTTPASGGGAITDDATKAPMTIAEYVRQQESDLPSATQYHLDVAPNAPEEGDIAAHWRCVNSCVLMGKIADISEGYVFESNVLQFTLMTHFEAPSPGDPDKDFHLVRVYDETYWRSLKNSLKEGDMVLVNGRLRQVPQYDATLRKYYHHPVVQVHPGAGMAIKTG